MRPVYKCKVCAHIFAIRNDDEYDNLPDKDIITKDDILNFKIELGLLPTYYKGAQIINRTSAEDMIYNEIPNKIHINYRFILNDVMCGDWEPMPEVQPPTFQGLYNY